MSMLAAAAALLFATGCDGWLTKPSLYNTVRVSVTRTDGAPIAGVPLVLYTGQRPMGYGSTDSTGHFVFTRVPQGFYGVIATPPAGYDVREHLIGGPSSTVADHLIVAKDTLSPVHFTFLKIGPGTVSVHVADATGAPLANVPVTLFSPTRVQGVDSTDAQGRVSFASVPFGAYGVTIQRPEFYRDFNAPGDSLYATRDNLIVEQGAHDSVAFALPKCAGTVVALTRDQSSLPVAGVTAAFYTSTKSLGLAVSGADGRAILGPVACGTQMGVYITPPPGYSVTETRGSRYMDGFTATNGATTTVTLRIQKNS